MPSHAIDFYSGYLEELLSTIGARDITMVERYKRLGDHTKAGLGLPDDMMAGWDVAMERLIMEPRDIIETVPDAVAVATVLKDAGQRRYRVVQDEREPTFLREILKHIGRESFADDLINSAMGGLQSHTPRLHWGFLDVNQVEELLTLLFGDESYKETKTAAIAGRLSHMPRQDAEKALLDVGIETQNSVSHNIDYLIIGSKGTGGTKHDKVQSLQTEGHAITVLDEDGFDRLVMSPKPPLETWSDQLKGQYEDFVSSLRHVWAFELDLFVLCYEYDAANNQL